MTTKGADRLPAGHTAIAPEGSQPWDVARARCTVCDRPLVWVEASGNKRARWQHARFER